MRKLRERWIPQGSVEAYRNDELGAVAYVRQVPGRGVVGIAYSGKRARPDWHYSYRTAEALGAQIKRWLDGLQRSRAFRAEQHAKRKATGRGLQVGDVLRSMWGYEQTNVDYYEVTALVGETMVELRKIGAHSEETAWAQGRCAPAVGEYIGEPFRRVAKDGRVTIDDCRSASCEFWRPRKRR